MSAMPADAQFELLPGAHVLFTSRTSGNLSSRSGEGREHAHDARDALRARLGLRSLEHSLQVHGTNVRVIGASCADPSGGDGEDVGEAREADGHASAAAEVGLVALSADCLPVALASGRTVAMLHAGWRGLAAGVLEEGVAVLRSLARDSEGPREGAVGGDGEIVAAIGPGAGVCCYEVGEEVHAAFGGGHRVGSRIDLKALARERLLAAGAREVLDAGTCTICDERFFSHRREGARAGRQAGVAWLR